MANVSRIVLLVCCCYCLASPAYAQDDGVWQLTQDEYQNGYPDWSPDGQFIVYTSVRDGDEQLWRIHPGHEPEQLTPYRAHHGNYSPDGRYIVFDGERGTLIQLMPSAGGVPTRIVPESIPILQSGLPVWSPDGTRIAFHAMYELYFLDLPTGAITELYRHETLKPLPVQWSKTEDVILISLYDPDTWHCDLYKLPLAGGEPQQLTFNGDVMKGSTSPDGAYVAYDSRGGGEERDLWVMRCDGGAAVRMTSDPAKDMEPCWSPDGNHIVFVSTRSGAWDLWMMDIDQQLLARELEALNSR